MIKAYTDLEQSKRLAKFLPIDSADMVYIATYYDDNGEPLYTADYKSEYVWEDNEVIHCWSLAALLEIIPVTIERADNRCRLRIDKSEKDFEIWYKEVDSDLAQLDLDIITPNIVDACVEMIEKLHNEKLL